MVHQLSYHWYMYHTPKNCIRCGRLTEYYSDDLQQYADTGFVCDDCHGRSCFAKLFAQAVKTIDADIVTGRIVQGVRKLCNYLSVLPAEAMFPYQWRYTLLKAQHPHWFTVPDRQYWSGFYT